MSGVDVINDYRTAPTTGVRQHARLRQTSRLILANALDVNGNLQIDLGSGNYVLINGLSRAQLSYDDVFFDGF